MKLFKALTFSIIAFLSLSTHAENGINSPYTRFGFGQLSSPEIGSCKSMGGTGIGIQNTNQINMLNPASYAAVDTLTFLLDVGMSISNTNMAQDGMKINSRNSTFDHLTMQFRLIPHLGMTIGMTPYSNIGYDFNETRQIYNDEEGQIIATNRYYGTGGLRQITAGLGYSPFTGLSVGANFSYVYGEIYHYVYNQYSDSNIDSRVRQYRADVTTYNLNLGIQYQAFVGKNRFTFGATYQPGHAIDDDAYTIETISANDTLSRSKMRIPTTFGVGLSYTYDNRLTIGADYSLQQYNAVEFFGVRGIDRHRASIGMEYIPEHLTRNIFRRTRYRAGIHCATAYYGINGNQGPTEYGATIGIGLPIMNRWNGKSIINISGQYIHTRPKVANMIIENALCLNIGISFNETWFNKWKVQ